VDPLAFDSAMQLSGYAAWVRYRRAGTPVGFETFQQLRPFPEGGLLSVEVTFGEQEADRFRGTLSFRDDSGTLLAVAEGVTAELRKAETDADAEEEPFEIDPVWVDPSLWPEVQEIGMRLEAAMAMGIANPFFAVHEGTARDTTQVAGRELVNFSSYNYIGLSGDERVLADTHDAVDPTAPR
jgi:hypothetical protein